MGIRICTFNGGEEIVAVGSKIELTTVKSPLSYKWLKTNVTYSEQLTFSFSVCKNFCDNNDVFFTPEEQSEIIRWLVRKEYHYLSFEQDGFENIYYNCVMTLEKKESMGKVIGFTATITCDAPFGYSELRTAKVNSNINKIFDTSEEIGYIVPETVLTATADGTIEIYNDNTNETVRVANCVAGEQITFTELMRISSNKSTHTTLYDDFNWVFPKIQNTLQNNINIFTLTNCTFTMSWREIRKAVV